MKTVKKVLRYLKKYTFQISFAILIAFVSVILTLYVPILIGYAIDEITGPSIDFSAIISILMKALAIAGLAGCLQWAMSIINNKVTYQVVRDIRNEAFVKIQKLPLKYLDEHQSGEILSRIVADVEQFADGLLMGFTQLFTGVVTILGTLYFMLTIEKKITFIVVLVTPLSLFVANFIAKKTYSMFKLQSEIRGEETALIDEMIGNEKVVKSFGHEKLAIQEFDEINEKLKGCSLRALFFSSLTNPCTRFVNSVVYALVALTGAFSVISGAMTVGALSCFLSYANQYTKPFNEISGVITELQNALACAARIFEFIEEEEESDECKDSVELSNVSGDLTCEDVAFSYVSNKSLIENFSLDVKAGQTVAIVGPTGCGKTTLINLLMRFYDVDKGAIKIDGVDIKQLTRKSLRKSYGMVLQETWLKNASVLDNIKMGKPEATIEEVVNAAKAVHSHSFIKRLPQGYDTIIGEDGGMLSQGQKQLLCITRIMLSLPPMLILDEATSSIDTRTEIKIQQAFSKLMEGRTSFIVAHRLSTIENADIILVMKDGKIIEKGNHKDLLKKQGFYSNLYQSQFQN